MKVIIAGSRTIESYSYVSDCVRSCGLAITEIVSGGARGVDRLGEQFAKENGIPLKQFLADWDGLGRAAGLIRNSKMVEYADALVAIWDGRSSGTKDVTYKMRKSKKPVVVFVTEHVIP